MYVYVFFPGQMTKSCLRSQKYYFHMITGFCYIKKKEFVCIFKSSMKKKGTCNKKYLSTLPIHIYIYII